MRLALIILCVTVSGCLEVVDHTPEGACNVDDDCRCGQECSVRDAGVPRCGPRLTHTCAAQHDCALPTHCSEVMRDGGACGYLICQ